MMDDFHSLEESLKNYLMEELTDRYKSYNANFHKYNNLKIYIDTKKYEKPHFIVRIGISEGVYDAQKGEKLSGSLGTEEKIVRRWIIRNMHKIDWGAVWKQSKKTKLVTLKHEADDDDIIDQRHVN